MSLLFVVENKRVKPNPETLLISPFKEIWERDTTEQKTFAIEDLTFIEFMVSPKKSNPFHGYHDDIRREKIIDEVITREGWEEDELIYEAMDKVKEFLHNASPTYRFYESNRLAVQKTEDFFKNFEYSEVNAKSGNPLYKPSDVTRAVKDAGDVMKRLNEMKEKVDQEVFEETKTKGQKRVSPFAM